ncbi:hypothetical protein GCM10028807_50400 [Spirosoma daeguense]
MKHISRYVYLLPLAIFLLPIVGQAQIGMGGQPHPSAVLDLKGTNKAFYPPRLTTEERGSIADPQPGALVFDTDEGSLYLYDGINWMPVAFTAPENQFSGVVKASDGANGDSFGYSVSISGDYAIVGARGNASERGAAYVFARTGTVWLQQAKLTASDGASGDEFGSSVSIDGNYAAVGAPGDDAARGAAYMFFRSGSTWTQQSKLTASSGVADDYFGGSVSVSGNYVVVGAEQDEVSGIVGKGSAHVFLRSGTVWVINYFLSANDGAADDNFGRSVAISGDYVVVGADRDNVGSNTSQGSAYVFIRTNTSWTLQAKLLASDGTANDHFGSSVSIAGSYVVVGAPKKEAVYVFFRTNTTWAQQAKLINSESQTGDSFGNSVSISGNRLLIGAIGERANQGAAYLFLRSNTTWSQFQKLQPTGGKNTDNGNSVGLSESIFILGGPGFQSNLGKATFGQVR